MKTIDEVIKALEMCTADNCVCLSGCPYSEFADGDDGCEYHAIPAMQIDALHYLKIFQRHEERVRSQLDDLKEEYQPNEPLTWEQLKQMEGKPVWVELPHSYRKAWGLNDGMFTDAYGNDCITVKVLHDLWHLQKKQMGETWQAYRKEKE